MPTAPARPRPGTQAAKLLAVAAAFPDARFTLEDLTVGAWTAHPQEFGLRGYAARYPDTKVVALAFYSLCRRHPDLVRAAGDGRYALTAAGVDLA